MTKAAPPTPADKRRILLEAQLRENLKRRKEQARARREPPAGNESDAAEAPLPEEDR